MPKVYLTEFQREEARRAEALERLNDMIECKAIMKKLDKPCDRLATALGFKYRTFAEKRKTGHFTLEDLQRIFDRLDFSKDEIYEITRGIYI